MPADDAEAVSQCGRESGLVDRTVGGDERNEAADPWVRRRHHTQKVSDDGTVAYEFRTGVAPASAEPDRDRLVLAEIQRPLAAARREEDLSVADIAERLAIQAAGSASGDGDQHQPTAERGGERQR